MQTRTNRQLELPSGMRARLVAFRGRVWTIKLTEGALAAAFGLLLSYLVVFASDRIWDTPAWLRAAFLVVGSMGLGVWLPLLWHRWVWRTRRLDQVARLVRRRMPRLGDQLLGIVELVDGDARARSETRSDIRSAARSLALCRAAMRQVDEETRERDLQAAVPRSRRRAWAWAAGLPAVLTVLALALVPAAGTNALVRWAMPWTGVERYTFAHLEDLPAAMVVPYAESFSLSASLRPDTAWSPRQGYARYGEQEPVSAELQDGAYHFQLSPQKDGDRLTVSVGDASRSIEIRPTARPELTAMTASVALPDYLGYSRDLTRDVRGGSVSLVAGSEATFEATATRQLANAAVDGEPVKVVGSRLVTSPMRVTEAATLTFTWRDQLGLSAKEPFLLTVNALDDDAPTLSCRRLSREQVVLHDEVLSFEVLARDDFGVKTIGMKWVGIEGPGNPDPASGEKIVAAGSPEKRELEAVATFSARRAGVTPQSLELRLFVVDYLPNREPVYSPAYVVHVLSPEEHAIWLTSQLRRWFRAARNVHERERQLHQTNRELRQLAAADVDRPENRRRIESQAAAESANARQLSSLAMAGENLIKQAARNDQFNVATMEAWAGMLQALKDIAANRMPSVADLLREAAKAPGRLARAPPKAGAPADSAPRQSPPGVGVIRDSKSAGGAAPKQESESPAKVPSIADVESGFNELDDQKGESEASPASPGGGRLSLPVTVVQGGGPPAPPGNQSCPAGQKLEEAVEEQEDLLAEFEKVADELQRILDNLEGSTFVKRLKAASRAQSEIATGLNRGLSGSFGVKEELVDDRSRRRSLALSEREVAHSENLYFIREDLAAYSARIQEGKFRTVLKEMRTTQVVNSLRGIAATVKVNLNGQSIAHAEFWADTLDRWAEQLVGPG